MTGAGQKWWSNVKSCHRATRGLLSVYLFIRVIFLEIEIYFLKLCGKAVEWFHRIGGHRSSSFVKISLYTNILGHCSNEMRVQYTLSCHSAIKKYILWVQQKTFERHETELNSGNVLWTNRHKCRLEGKWCPVMSLTDHPLFENDRKWTTTQESSCWRTQQQTSQVQIITKLGTTFDIIGHEISVYFHNF